MSKRVIQEPVETTDQHRRLTDQSRSFAHPAFGQIGASRVQGDTVLHGTDFIHHNFIKINITRSELNRDLSRDWHFPREELIEVWISEAQWATFVSTLNHGTGIPCTLVNVGREQMPELPRREQTNVVDEELTALLKDMEATMTAAYEDIAGEIGRALPVKKRDAILNKIHAVRRKLGDSLPFMSKQFRKSMDRTIEHAKIEVEAHMHATVQRAGMAHLGLTAAVEMPITKQIAAVDEEVKDG